MVSGAPPVRAKKARYYEDPRLASRVMGAANSKCGRTAQTDDWSALPLPPRYVPPVRRSRGPTTAPGGYANTGIRREPGLPVHEEVTHPPRQTQNEFAFDDPEPVDLEAAAQSQMQGLARQASLDPGDGIQL